MPHAEHTHVSIDSRVELFPLAITRTNFKFQVVALGSQRTLFLTADEKTALEFLRKEKLLSKASARLTRYNARTDIDYIDLVERLIVARLVHRIDGREIERPYASWRQVAREGLSRRWGALPSVAGRWSQMIGSRLLPISWMIDLNRAAIRLSVRKARRAKAVNRFRSNMARVLVDTPHEELTRHASKAFADLIHMIAELALLQVAPDDRICRWVLRSVTRYDTAPLEAALAEGKGAIVFHYHMGPIQYVPLLLSALGFKVTLLGMSIARPRRSRMYFSVVDDLRPAGILKLLRALQRGEVVVISPDVDIHALDGPTTSPDDDRNSTFAGSWQKGSTLPVTFLGHRIQTYTGLVWLHEQSGSPLVFSSVDRNQHGDVSFRCARFASEDRDSLTRQQWTARTMDRVYRHYEREFYAHPEQWMHWLSFFPRHASISAH